MGGRRPHGLAVSERHRKTGGDGVRAYVAEVVETELASAVAHAEPGGDGSSARGGSAAAAGRGGGPPAGGASDDVRADVERCNTSVQRLEERLDAITSLANELSAVAQAGQLTDVRFRGRVSPEASVADAPVVAAEATGKAVRSLGARLLQLQLAQQSGEQQLEVLKERHAREAARKPPEGVSDLAAELRDARRATMAESEALRAQLETQQAALDAALSVADKARARAERAERALEGEAASRRQLEERLAALEAAAAAGANERRGQQRQQQQQQPSAARVVQDVLERLASGEGGWQGRLEALDTNVARLRAALGTGGSGSAKDADGATASKDEDAAGAARNAARALAESKDLRATVRRVGADLEAEQREARDARALHEGALEALRARLERAEEREAALRDMVGKNLRVGHAQAEKAADEMCKSQLRQYVGTIATEVCRVTREFVRVQMQESNRLLERELVRAVPDFPSGALTQATSAPLRPFLAPQQPASGSGAAVAGSPGNGASSTGSRTGARAGNGHAVGAEGGPGEAPGKDGEAPKLVIEGGNGQMATALGRVLEAYSRGSANAK